MIKKIILLLCLLLMAGLAASCKKGEIKTDSTEISSLPTVTAEPLEMMSPTSIPVPTVTPALTPYAGALAKIMSKENYPIVDGSTATIPLSEAVYQLATGATQEEAAADIVHTKTSNAYYRLMNKEADLLIVYAPSEQVLDDIKKGGNQLNMKPIGKDALVFMENASNPVESLTPEQLVDIYSGKIKNWSEVGGERKEILAFQRPENSGSQTLMLKLVMGEIPMISGPNVISYSSMEGILEAMADYTNEGNTLGYSVFYYAKNMYQLPELKFMKLNGIEPSLETIYDNSYPYINEFYAVIRKDEPVDSNAHRIFDWFTGEEGQNLVKDLGYVPVSMNVSNTEIVELLKEDVLPDGYKYVAGSYSSHDGLYVGNVTIFNNKWETTRVFQNAYVQEEIGLISEDAKLPIGYAVYQEDGSYAMRFGLYNLKDDTFALPADYQSIYVLDEEKGYYVASDEEGYHVIDALGTQLISGFIHGEGYGVTKRGEYYWVFDYSMELSQEKYSIYDSKFNLITEFTRDYDKGEIYDFDGTVYFSKKMFYKKFGYPDNPEDEFYIQSYNYGELLYAVSYNGTVMIMDKKLNVLAEKTVDANMNSYYNVYNNIFADSVYNNITYTETSIFYDKEGKLIMDKDGNSYGNIVSENYWRSSNQNKYEQVLYGITDHKLKIYHYNNGNQMKIDLGDWESASVSYVYKDLVIVSKMDGEQRTRVYKGNKLLYDKPGLYYLAPFTSTYFTDRILMVNYGSTGPGYEYILLNDKGELVYESSNAENIISIDEKYIQLERGNYWGVMDYEGNYIVRRITNGLRND